MDRFRITPLAAAGDLRLAPQVVEALSAKGALEAAYILPAGTKQIEGRGTVHFGRIYDEASGEVFGCAVVVDRLPSDAGKGAYRTAGEIARKPSDRGGSTRKHRSPVPFRRPVGIGAPSLVGSDGVRRDALIPDGGTYVNRAESAAAQRDLAAAGLGTLSGRGFLTACMVNPEHYCGIRKVEADSSAPLSIIAARVSPPSDAEVAARLAARPHSERVGGNEAAPQPRNVTPRSYEVMSGLAAALAVGRFIAA